MKVICYGLGQKMNLASRRPPPSTLDDSIISLSFPGTYIFLRCIPDVLRRAAGE